MIKIYPPVRMETEFPIASQELDKIIVNQKSDTPESLEIQLVRTLAHFKREPSDVSSSSLSNASCEA